ncbi:hypothetical protein C3K47_03005 [Solitalea longa]|uniref:Uncharacterized protein n=1 Tax=Solitalea longa TaxID=2079460 RepID=A0A2S5A7Q6_9SPHI|nr:hypothetical protein [Solitalea longa]POY38382.1 hypothetical protein C3K47_03005 [Solitalea longa]
MKKNLLILAILLFSVSHVFAQKEALVDTITQKICLELKGVNIDKLSADSASNLFEKTMTKVCLEHMGSLMEYYDLMGPNANEAGTQLGNDVAKQLMKSCPAFVDFAMKMAATDETSSSSSAGTESVSSNFNGKLTKVVKGDFYRFICTSEQGLQETFYWLQNCGAEKLLPDPNKYVGKKVKINFTEVSYFIPSEGNYKKIKTMTVFNLVD